MATPSKPALCTACGYAKNPPGAVRCDSCGQRLDTFTSGAREGGSPYAQEGVSPLWLLIAVVVQAALTFGVLFGLPELLPVLDFEGGNGIAVCVPLWCFGGLVIGLISPGRTFAEPTLASFLVAIPSTYLLIQSQTVRVLPTFLYVVCAGIGVLFTLIGAYFGERMQLGPAPKPSH